MENFNKLRNNMYVRLINSKGEKGNTREDFEYSFAENALPWIRYRLMIELEESVFKSTTGSNLNFRSTSFEQLMIGTASELELAIIRRYSGTPDTLFWNICIIYIGGKDILNAKKEFRDVYMSCLGDDDRQIQEEHMHKFHVFFEREDPHGVNNKKGFSQENDYFVDFI